MFHSVLVIATQPCHDSSKIIPECGCMPIKLCLQRQVRGCAALCSGLRILCFFLSQVTLGRPLRSLSPTFPVTERQSCSQGHDEPGLGLRCLSRVYGAVSALPLCCYSVAKSCLILYDLIDQSPPGSPVFHYPPLSQSTGPL